jgi:hypothetical protein
MPVRGGTSGLPAEPVFIQVFSRDIYAGGTGIIYTLQKTRANTAKYQAYRDSAKLRWRLMLSLAFYGHIAIQVFKWVK